MVDNALTQGNDAAFAALLDTVPDAMVIIDRGGEIVLANRQAESLFGYPRDELAGMSVEQLVPADLAEAHVEHRRRFFDAPSVRPMGQHHELEARHCDGSRFPVEISLSPVEVAEGLLASASIRDVTDRRRTEAMHRWQADFSTRVVDSLPGLFYLIDRNGRMRHWNANLEAVSGFSRRQVANMTPHDFVAEVDKPRVEKAFQEVFRDGQSEFEAPIPGPDGAARDYHFVGRRITLGDEQFLTGLALDITPIKQTESRLEYVSGLQRVLVEASKRFIASDPGQLDDLITEVLGRVGAYCEVDRSYLFRFKDNRKRMDNTHEWCATGINPEIDNLQDLPREAVPMVVTLMEAGEIAYIPHVDELGPEWDQDRKIFEDEDIRSLILVPIIVGEQPYGFIGFDSVRRQRNWNDEEIWLLEVLADLIGTVVERETAGQALREAETRYRSVVEHIREVVFQTDRQGRWTFLNPAWEEITGFPVEDSLGEAFPGFVYPEDRAGSENVFSALMRGHKRVSRSEVRYLTRQGDFRWLEVNLRTTADAQGNITGCAGTMRDVTKQREAERKMHRLAHYDPVTHLPNRVLALDRLDQLLKTARRTGELVAVLFLDLDHFKKANDSLGHEAGDELLREAATRLLDHTREQDTVARFGGDEYLILIGGLNDAMEAQPVAEKLLHSFRQPFSLQGREFLLTASVGIAISPDDGHTPQDLLRNADMAMYESKSEGRNTYHYFTEAMNRDVERRLSIEEQLRGALERNELSLVFQPIVDLTTQTVVGAEALLRWHNALLGEVSPEEFVPIAEQTGLIDAIGDFVLEQALLQAARWRVDQPSFCTSVNVSPQQFRNRELVARIAKELQRHDLPGEALQVEVTESVLLEGHPRTSDALAELKDRGVSVAMDDFGTGYASLSYLRQFPFDALKIDRSFVRDITEDPHDYELVVASLAMAHGLGLTVAAEGVETSRQLTMLHEHGCHLAQGFLFGRPLEAKAFTRFLASDADSVIAGVF